MMIPTSLASFFTVAIREYEKIRFGYTEAQSATFFIYGACFGVLLAALCIFYQKNVPGAVVRALLRAQAFSPNDAKSAEELGFPPRSLYALELKRGSTLRRIVATVPGDVPRYYVPEGRKYRAEIRFDKKGNGVAGLIVTALLAFAIALLLINLLPVLLGMIDAMLK